MVPLTRIGAKDAPRLICWMFYVAVRPSATTNLTVRNRVNRKSFARVGPKDYANSAGSFISLPLASRNWITSDEYGSFGSSEN